MADEKLDSTALRIVKRVAKTFPEAIVSSMTQSMVDGTEKPSVSITIPTALKSGRRLMLVLLASELDPGKIQLTRLFFKDGGSSELKQWVFPESAQEHIKLFIEEYEKRNHPDLLITDLEDGNIDVSYFFLMKDLSDMDVYNFIRLCIAHNLDIDARLTAAEAGNMDGIIDYIGAAKDSNDDDTTKRLHMGKPGS